KLGSLQIAERIAFHDVQQRVILPTVGISDAHFQRAQLLLRLGFGLGRHPRQSVDPLAERFHQIVHHRLYLRLGFRWEVPLDVKLANYFSESRTRVVHTALPPRAQLRSATE